MKNIFLSLFWSLSVISANSLFAQGIKNTGKFSEPVFQVDVKDPTADKPQCKLWYTGASWWAVIPKSTGPSLWQRTGSGWVERKEIATALSGVPGRADVLADAQGATAVGVGASSLTVFRLDHKPGNVGAPWSGRTVTTLRPPIATDEIETATIARDVTGQWWVASDAGDKICVWSGSKDSKAWTAPIVLGKGINKDDICTISTLPEGVLVIWSDQNADKVSARLHKNGRAEDDWEGEVIIEAGNKTADDHLHTAFSSDGTLWLATKNSVDKQKEPQQVLRVRSANGVWKNIPYANLDAIRQPSRPVVVTTDDPNVVLAGHTIYNTSSADRGEIVFGIVDTKQVNILKNEQTVMVPNIKGARINNITTPKDAFRKGVPWIVLASDNEGRVYEADLSGLFR